MSGTATGIFRTIAALSLAYLVTSILMAGRRVLHGNHETFAFHIPGCRFYDSRNCTEVFGTRKAALAAGFHPARCCAT
jgi:hypothetical protein